jgi:hypothetical protein
VSPSGAATPTGSAPSGAPALALEIITSPNILTGWLVVVTITNPAPVMQTWTNVSVQAAAPLAGDAVESHTEGARAYGSGSMACVEPTASAAIAAGSSISIDFTINVNVDISQPRARLNDGTCRPPAAG